MAQNRWSPMGELAGLHTAMDRLFSDFFGSPLPESSDAPPRTSYLPIDIIDNGSAYQVNAAVPGFDPDDVEVTYSDGVLHIAAQRKAESTSRAGSYLRRELTLGNYVRTIQLPGDVRENEIKASFDKGILTVDIPKVPKSQPVKIQVTGKSQKQLVGTGSQK